MSKEPREESNKERELADATLHKRKLRSPCADAHYEAYILRSRWTVGNLYASNLYLGHIHVKYVQDIDRQLKTWLHSKERDQQQLAKRVLELEALKKQSFEKSMRFIDEECPTKEVGRSAHKMISRHISLEAAKQHNPMNAPLHGLHYHGQTKQLPDVFPPKHPLGTEKARSRPKAADISLNPLKLLLPNQSGQRRTKSGYVYQKGSIAPIHQQVMSGRFSSLSSRWNRRRTSLSANPRFGGVSHEKGGGKKLVPKWVPLAFRL